MKGLLGKIAAMLGFEPAKKLWFPPQFRTGTPAKRTRIPGKPGVPASRCAYAHGAGSIGDYDRAMSIWLIDGRAGERPPRSPR